MKLTLVDPKDYVAEATNLIHLSKHRVVVIAMVVADHGQMRPMIDALIKAAQRGVKVSVAADVFTYGEVNGSFLPIRYASKGPRAATAMAKELRKAGVHFAWLGHGRVTLFNGRTHSKWCVIDNTSFVFGGVNLYEEGLNHTDYMFRVNDKELADHLDQEWHHIIRAERTSTNFRSHQFTLPVGVALFDGGIVGRSIIYKRACELTKLAKHVTFVSQYCPTSRLAKELKNVPHTLYFNRPEQASFLNKILLNTSMAVSGFQTSYTKKPYIHAKYMIFTMHDDTKIALTGSHNFAFTGVVLGTREIALETSNLDVIEQLERFTATKIV